MSPLNQGGYLQQPSIRIVPLLALVALLSPPLTAQSPPSDSTPPARVPPPTQASSALPFAFSGVLYLNYQYGGPVNSQSANRFDVDRAYLNFRAAAGSRDSIRVTLD